MKKKTYVPLEKRSKKEKKAYYKEMRNDWGILNPITREVPSGKTYDRNKMKQKDKRSRMEDRYDQQSTAFCISLN